MTDRPRLYHLLARDDGVSEVVAYIFMFALGAVALTFSLDVLVDTQETGSEIAASIEVKEVAQVTASLIERAARVGQTAPNASYNLTYELPANQHVRSYNVSIRMTTPQAPDCETQPEVFVITDDAALNTTVPLSNLTTHEPVVDGSGDVVCELVEGSFDLEGSFHSSAAAVRVKYERTAEPTAEPRIVLEPANQVS